MPIYEFHCTKCEQDSEILVRSNRWKGAKCPRCGSTRLEKKLSVFASSGGVPASEACCATTSAKSSGCGCCCGGGKHRH